VPSLGLQPMQIHIIRADERIQYAGAMSTRYQHKFEHAWHVAACSTTRRRQNILGVDDYPVPRSTQMP